MMREQKVTVEEKVRIVREYLKGQISISEGAREAKVDFETLRSWIGIYENHGAEGFMQKRHRHYSAETKTAAVIDYSHLCLSTEKCSKRAPQK